MELFAAVILSAVFAGALGFMVGQRRTEKKAHALEIKLAEETQIKEAIQRDFTAAAAEGKDAREKRDLLAEEAAALKARCATLEENLPSQFENLANKVLEQSSQKLSKTSEENLGQILNPLKDRLAEFQKKVDDTYNAEARERFALKNEIEKIVNTNESLTTALRGSSKAQGNWGEYILTKLLEDSGLREGEQFTTQGRDLKIKGADGQHLQPDVILNLPDSKHLVIDSKVSLTHYEQFMNAESDGDKKQALDLFLNSVRTHVKGLAEKDYASAERISSPDFVFLFMPIEGAHSLALQSDGELFNFAWEKRIVLVSPTTLMASLRTVASLWKMEKQNRNTLEIARQGGALYDKFVGFVESMENIGLHLGRSQKAYDDAYGKLKDGRGNLITSSEKLRELGAKTSKSIPEKLLSETDETEKKALENSS
jgi:DNA recombination protein RmuC